MNRQLLALLQTQVKRGVVIDDLTPHMDNAITAAANVAYDLDIPSVITSGTDGEHKEGSLHYAGMAIDVRRGDWPTFEQPSLAQTQATMIKSRLGPEYDVILEDSHIHIEYDPKPTRV